MFYYLTPTKMKKVLLSLAVLASVALVSCDNKGKDKDTACVDTTTATEEVVPATDTTTVADENKADENKADENKAADEVAPADSVKK